MKTFQIGDTVRIKAHLPYFNSGRIGEIVRIGSRADWPGTWYLIRFEGGGAIETKESSLERAEGIISLDRVGSA